MNGQRPPLAGDSLLLNLHPHSYPYPSKPDLTP